MGLFSPGDQDVCDYSVSPIPLKIFAKATVETSGLMAVAII